MRLKTPWGKAPRDSLTARFVLVASGAVVGALALSFAIFAAARPNEVPVFSARWLVEHVAAVARETFERPAAQRAAFLAEIGDPPGLSLQWRETKPELDAGDVPRWPQGLALGLLRAALGDRAKQVLIEIRASRAFWRPPFRDIDRAPEDMHRERSERGERGGRERMRDFPLPGPFRIAIEGRDGSWLVISAASDFHGRRMVAAALWVGAILLVVGGLSWWAARRLTRPLDRLAAAAERLGIDRSAPAVAEEGPRELQAIAQAFNRMRERIGKYLEERTGLVAAVSHDLRTQLTRLRLRAESIADEAERAKVLDDIAEMEAMIAATLDFAREDRRDEPLQAVDLAALLQSLVDDRADAGADIAYDGPDRADIACRPTALKRAFANLIDNAVKYGGGGSVRLADAEGALRVEIVDRGPGIPAAEREAVFRPFYRLETSRSRETGGVGLGLSIARDILRSHGGTIALGDGEPKGLRVTVEIPKIPLCGT